MLAFAEVTVANYLDRGNISYAAEGLKQRLPAVALKLTCRCTRRSPKSVFAVSLKAVRGLSVFFWGGICVFFFSFLGLKSQEMASYAQVIE